MNLKNNFCLIFGLCIPLFECVFSKTLPIFPLPQKEKMTLEQPIKFKLSAKDTSKSLCFHYTPGNVGKLGDLIVRINNDLVDVASVSKHRWSMEHRVQIQNSCLRVSSQQPCIIEIEGQKNAAVKNMYLEESPRPLAGCKDFLSSIHPSVLTRKTNQASDFLDRWKIIHAHESKK